jgi:hypothetical protein
MTNLEDHLFYKMTERDTGNRIIMPINLGWICYDVKKGTISLLGIDFHYVATDKGVDIITAQQLNDHDKLVRKGVL